MRVPKVGKTLVVASAFLLTAMGFFGWSTDPDRALLSGWIALMTWIVLDHLPE